jgi:hypothetical protein
MVINTASNNIKINKILINIRPNLILVTHGFAFRFIFNIGKGSQLCVYKL